MRNSKWILLISGISGLLGFSVIASAVEDCDRDVNFNNGNTYQDVTGTVTCRDRDSGKMVRQVTLKQGKKNGEEIRYDSKTGKKKSSMFYVNDQRHGPYIEYDLGTGKIIEQSTYEKDGERGVAKKFSPDGQLHSISYSMPGNPSDTRLEYTAAGKLTDIQCGEHSVGAEDVKLCGRDGQIGTAMLYRENGQLISKRQYLDGKLNGVFETYGDKGQLLSQENWKAGKRDGISKKFRIDGNLEHQQQYVAGTREGEQLEFFADGKSKKKMEILQQGKKIAETTWYQNGHMASKEEPQGNLRQVSEYHDNGQLSRQATWDPALNRGTYYQSWVGAEKQYYENGKLKLDIHYTDKGQKQGIAQYYHDNGQLAVKEVWESDVLQQKTAFDEQGVKLSDEAYYPDGSRKY